MKLPARFWLTLLLVVATVACYARVIPLPLVQDDWGVMARFEWTSRWQLLREFCAIEQQLFVRPGGMGFLLLEHGLFGTESIGYHLVALLLHVTNALLVSAVVRVLAGDARIGWVTGLLYAGSTSIHLDSMIWAVGIYDLGATCFVLLSVFTFARGRPLLAALALVLALSFRESAVAMPIVLLAIARWHPGAAFARRWRAWWPTALVVAGHLALKSRGVSPFSLPSDHPYAAAVLGPHVFENLHRYAVWAVQAVLPMDSPFGSGVTMALLAVVAAATVFLGRGQLAALGRRWSGPLLVLAVWATATLLPVLFLRQHAYRYYLSASLPALLAAGAIVAVALLEATRASSRVVVGALALVTGALFVSAASHLQRVMNEGLNQRSLVWGTNHLVRRALLVDMARDALIGGLAGAPVDAVVVLADFDLVAIEGAAGPRVWLDAPALAVYDVAALRRDDNGFWLMVPGAAGATPIGRDRLRLFRREADRVVAVDLDSWR